MEEIKIFSPATVANVSCGFDVLGLCLDTVGDEMVIKKNKLQKVRITKIEGQKLPLEVENNVAGIAVLALLNTLKSNQGFDIEIYKKIKPGSGIGSSAASAAGAVFGVNELLGKPYSKQQLVTFAMEGEQLASGTRHADNVAPALLGGFSLIRSYSPIDILQIPFPKELFVTVIHPKIEVKTADARSILKQQVSLQQAVKQSGNLAGLICGLFTHDFDLIGRSLHDELVEPLRSLLIPNFDVVKQNVLKVGALGCGISGSGPSIFALSKGKGVAKKVAKAMEDSYKGLSINYEVFVSKINKEGIKTLSVR